MTDIDVAGLLRATADIANVNLVAAVPDGQRTTLKFAFSSVPDLLQQLTSGVGLQVQVQDKRVAILHAACQKSTPTVSGIDLPQSVSLNFRQIPLGVLIGLFDLHPDLADAVTAIHVHQRLSVRVRDLPGNGVLKAAATALGVDILGGADRLVRLADLAATECELPDISEVFDSETERRRVMPPSNHCPYRRPSSDEAFRRCEPLEYFGLRTLVPRGYLEIERQKRRIAYVEGDSDGDVHLVRKGAYMGRDFGKVMDISVKGIELREIFQDVDGEWKEWPAIIPYGERFMPREVNRDNGYVSEGSPQSEYNMAVNTLFLMRESVPNTARLCARDHPETTQAIASAIADWEKRHAEILPAYRRHVAAYAERMAEDHGFPFLRVMVLARRQSAEFLRVYLGTMGSLNGAGLKAYCEGFPALLKSDAMDLPRRFAREFSLLRGCAEAATCPNF